MRRLIKLLSLPLIALPLIALMVVFSVGRSGSSSAHAATTDIAIDVDAAPGVQASTTLAVGASTHIQVDLTSLGPVGYVGYQVKMFYDDVILNADGTAPHLPSTFNNAPTANTGGNVAAFPNGPDCGPVPGGNAEQDNDINGQTTEDNLGTNSLLMFCNDNAVAPQSTLQPLVDFFVTCAAPGTATLSLANRATDPQGGTNVTDDTFNPAGDNYAGASITCANATDTPTNTPQPPTATNTPVPPTSTPVPGTRVQKVPQGNANNVDLTDPNFPLANLWLCSTNCSGPGEGSLSFDEVAFLSDPNDHLGAFEFQIKFDHKIFDINGDGAHSSWDIQVAKPPLGNDGRTWDQDTQCFDNVTENYINFACTSTGPVGTGFTGVQSIPIAHVTLHPDSDLQFRIRPGNNNGIIRAVLDENCELSNEIGHPLSGAVAGGLTPTCGDLGVTVRILEGDVNLDCSVDATDAQEIAQRYGQVMGLTGYDPWFDLEPNITDFDIDVKDLQKVFGREGSTCQTPVPPQPPIAPAGGDSIAW